MTVRILWLIFVLAELGAGCAEKKVERPGHYVDPYLATYIEDFVADAAGAGIPVGDGRIGKLRVVKFVDSMEAMQRKYGQTQLSDESLDGACSDIDVDSRLKAGSIKVAGKHEQWQEIWISNSVRTSSDAPDIVLRELMYHELGHCLLGLDHAPQLRHSIMSPTISGNAKFLTTNWERLVAELFAQAM